MDGLDWMTIAEVVPITTAMVLLGAIGEFPLSSTFVAGALCGALIGFAPFNRPIAKIFLGDVGSLPIGLLLGWLLLELAYHENFVAALLLPLYYLSDTTVTLMRRLARREIIWSAHRTHFYQRATDHGFTTWRVIREVFAVNLILAMLATASAVLQSTRMKALCLFIGCLAVALLLYRFSRPRNLV